MDFVSSELTPDIINIHQLNSTHFVKQEIEDWFPPVKKEQIEDPSSEDFSHNQSNEFIEDSKDNIEQCTGETEYIYPRDDFSKHWCASFMNSGGDKDVETEDIVNLDLKEGSTTVEEIEISDLYKSNTESLRKSSKNTGKLQTENYKCHFCDFNCSRKYTLNRHMDCIHLKLKKFKCDMCTFQTGHKATLKIHIVSVHLNLKNYKCLFCDFDSSTKAKLKRHIDAIHLNLKRFKCVLCDFRSAAKYKLKMHIDSVHLKLKTQKCNFCDFVCSTQSDLKKHIDGVHLRSKNFKCQICDFNTFRKDTLNTHVSAVHLKLKKYKCELCNSCFAKKHNLKMHYKCCPLSKERT